MLVDWSNPTIRMVYNNDLSFEASNAVIEINDEEWVYLAIHTTLGVPHPIHLHGHDFFFLAQGAGTYNSSVMLNLENPPRRDTAMLPSTGYLVIAFLSDNPGLWLMHCHIGWHTSEGFGLQFVERRSELVPLIAEKSMTDTCDAWSSYVESHSIEQDDSGI